MGIVFFSDVHAHNWKQYNRVTKSGIGSRLNWCVSALREVDSYAQEHNHDVVFCGDLFQAKDSIETEVLVRTYSATPGYVLVAGNHDILYSGVSVLNVFDDDVRTTVTQPPGMWLEMSGFSVSFCPFSYDLETMRETIRFLAKEAASGTSKDKFKVLATHCEVNDAAITKNEMRAKHVLAQEDFAGFDLVVSGHYHIPQSVGKVVYCGALLQNRWGEDGKIRNGFIVLDRDAEGNVSIDRVPVSAPRFIDLPEGEEKPTDKGDIHYYRTVTKPAPRVQAQRAPNLTEESSEGDLVRGYVEAKTPDLPKKEQNALVKVGMKVIEGVAGR